MDQKSWIWKKRSTEKTLIADKASNSSRKGEDEETEVHKLLTEKTDLERELQILKEKLSSALSESDAKDDIAKKQVKISEDAISGWEKSENEVTSLKQELNNVLQQKAASEERTAQLDAALKECMHQLRSVREEQEYKVHGEVLKASEEFKKIKMALDGSLAEAGKRLVKLEAENTQLSKALLLKAKAIEDLSKYKVQVDVDFNALRSRLESTEKENASLKYEVRVLEKELDIRNEEIEFNRRMAEAARKQHQESLKKISKLETECQRLRLLVRKRLPGPAALAKMKSEVELLGKDQVKTRRRKSNLSPTSSMEIIELEEENRALKDALNEKSSEIQFSKTMHARTASRLSRAEEQVERGKNLRFLQENSLVASSDVGSDDKASCESSWASALISELEHFKNEKHLGPLSQRNITASEMDLMDDFAEMEKLAVASVDVIQTLTDNKTNSDPTNGRNGNNVSIKKIVELLEGINIQSQDKGVVEFFDDKLLSYKASENPTGYMVRVFQWKTAELSATLQRFVGTCNDLLNGSIDLELFAHQVASTLEWIINHCFSIQDVSSMKDAIRSHLDWDESRSEMEVDSVWANYSVECNKLPIFGQDNISYLPMVSPLSGNNNSCQMEANTESEIIKHESKDVIENLNAEVETIKRPEGDFGNETEKHKMMREDLESQVMETNHEWRKACERISHLEKELENKNHFCKRLEEKCCDLQIQLKSIASKEVPDNGRQGEKQLQNDWEITAASEKLAECQETILSLGKQLKSLASPSDAPLFDKVISTPADSVLTTLSTPRKNSSRRSCLLDKMLAEDSNLQLGASTETKKDVQNGNGGSGVGTNGELEVSSKFVNQNGIIDREVESKSAIALLDIVPCKKNRGRGFFKKFWQQRKRNGDRKILLIGCS